MATASAKLFVPSPSTTCAGYPSNQRQRSNTVSRPLQVTCPATREPFHTLACSRREAMISFSTYWATTLVQISPAEARTANLDIRRKIMEKLQMLREKAGLSKEKEPGPSPAVEESSPSSEITKKIEVLKEKVSITNEDNSLLSKEETKSEATEEKVPPADQIKEKVEMLKEKLGLLVDGEGILSKTEAAEPHPAMEKPQPSNVILQLIRYIEEKLGL